MIFLLLVTSHKSLWRAAVKRVVRCKNRRASTLAPHCLAPARKLRVHGGGALSGRVNSCFGALLRNIFQVEWRTATCGLRLAKERRVWAY